VTEFGMSLAEIDDAPALTLDWLLSIHDTVKQVEAEQAEREAGR
jgi:hypothetical protein